MSICGGRKFKKSFVDFFSLLLGGAGWDIYWKVCFDRNFYFGGLLVGVVYYSIICLSTKLQVPSLKAPELN